MDMEEVLLKSSSLVFLIVLGYVLKRVGIFKQEDSRVFVRAMLYVTLPATLLLAFRDFHLDMGLIALLAAGAVIDAITAAIGWKASRKEEPRVRAMYMLCTSGVNVGSFVLPFLQVFFPQQLLSVVMFDVGNSVLCSGGVYSVAATLLHPGEKFSLKQLGKNLLHTWPFDLYTILFFMGVFKVRLPEPVYDIAAVISGGNAVVVMLMLGIMLEIRLSRSARRQVLEIIGLRAVIAVVLALGAYFLLPFPLDTRKALALTLCGPCTSMAAIFGAKLGCDTDVCGTTISLSILLSIAMILGCLFLWAM